MHACTDLEPHKQEEIDTSQSSEELRIAWYASRAHRVSEDGWVRDGEKLLLWVPWKYRPDIDGGTRMVFDPQGEVDVRPKADYRKVFRFSGTRWKDIYTGDE